MVLNKQHTCFILIYSIPACIYTENDYILGKIGGKIENKENILRSSCSFFDLFSGIIGTNLGFN